MRMQLIISLARTQKTSHPINAQYKSLTLHRSTVTASKQIHCHNFEMQIVDDTTPGGSHSISGSRGKIGRRIRCQGYCETEYDIGPGQSARIMRSPTVGL